VFDTIFVVGVAPSELEHVDEFWPALVPDLAHPDDNVSISFMLNREPHQDAGIAFSTCSEPLFQVATCG